MEDAGTFPQMQKKTRVFVDSSFAPGVTLSAIQPRAHAQRHMFMPNFASDSLSNTCMAMVETKGRRGLTKFTNVPGISGNMLATTEVMMRELLVSATRVLACDFSHVIFAPEICCWDAFFAVEDAVDLAEFPLVPRTHIWCISIRSFFSKT